MKTTNYLFVILMAALFALAGCGKSGNPQPPAAATLMDISKLQQAFPSPTPEVQTSLDKFRLAMRYRQFDIALAELDKLANTAGITDEQKKAVTDKIDQVKQAVSAATAKPSQ